MRNPLLMIDPQSREDWWVFQTVFYIHYKN